MAIELEQENVLRVSRAKGLPGNPSKWTLKRWINEGRTNPATGQIVFLEHVRIGGCIYTSREAVCRFIDRLTSDEPFVVGER